MTRRIYKLIDGTRGVRVVRDREGETMKTETVTIVPTKQLSASLDGIHAVDLAEGVPVDVPRRMADAYLERGDAVLPDADAPADDAQDAQETPEPVEGDDAPSEDANDAQDAADAASEDDADEPAADPDDVAGDQAAALAALLARGKDELHAAAKANDVRVHHNAGAEKVARALLAAGVTVEA